MGVSFGAMHATRTNETAMCLARLIPGFLWLAVSAAAAGTDLAAVDRTLTVAGNTQ